MNILISSKEKIPIYEQLVNSIRTEILTGRAKENDPLPSIRSLSKSLEISIITVKRAYDELEKEGLIFTLPGKGSFVSAQEIERIREFKMVELQEELSDILNSAKEYGISKETIIDLIKLL
ncbi:GntR family transcriptional regulator [Anaerosphaera aminiphila DSM 21120]|uniref:GntR family transcriptional regulator n=1 Tax=Anaerosphaera aminiphila DSM 21120 TaxID=1120995 RepID=A0A1M5PVP8_9FIRM|nr:GntR family transcriptional regulator [Anaerosphaera aminiphila]SHH05772.1 GntR family transcriptional regulator [Anaerosphaera aminiphila DSM 21120]